MVVFSADTDCDCFRMLAHRAFCASAIFRREALALLWFGVAGVLYTGNTNLMHVFWPSSVMLVGGWCCTVPGIMITASSVVINCSLYMGAERTRRSKPTQNKNRQSSFRYFPLLQLSEFIRSASPLGSFVRCGQPNWPDY